MCGDPNCANFKVSDMANDVKLFNIKVYINKKLQKSFGAYKRKDYITNNSINKSNNQPFEININVDENYVSSTSEGEYNDYNQIWSEEDSDLEVKSKVKTQKPFENRYHTN